MKILINNANKRKKRSTSLYCVILTALLLLFGAGNMEIIAQQTEKTITGLVTDADGNPLVGVSIGVKGSTAGALTDLDGKYSIKVRVRNVLVFTYLGHNTEEREIKEETTSVNIKMLESSLDLDEVVVVGYGQQKKESVVSAINSIGPKELAVTGRNLTNSIAGQIAGIIAIQPSGEPGYDDSNFWIRGVSSFAGGTAPLVLVDGIPRAMSNITVDEIETFTVLKDAAATAVYGAEGANGVILITSKRGKVQKTSFSFRAEETMRTPIRVPELMSSYEYLSLANEAIWNDAKNPLVGYIPTYSDEVLRKYYDQSDPDLYPDADWLSMLKKHTRTSRYTLNIRGGNDKVRFFTSGGYYHEDGIYNTHTIEDYNANLKYERYNLRSNVDMDLTKTTRLSVDVGGYYTVNNAPSYTADQYFRAFTLFPTHVIPMYYSDGTNSAHPESTGDINSWRINPYNMLNLTGYYKRWTITAQSKVNLEQKLDFITKGLSWKGSMSLDAYVESGMGRSKSATTYYASGRDAEGKLIKTQRDNGSALGNPTQANSGGKKNIYLETSLNYNHLFNEVHELTGLLLYNQKESQNQTASGMNLLPVRKQSVVSRAVYVYDTRYVIEANFGMTASDNFASGHRWGFFPAAGAAWYVSHEKFMEGIQDYLSKLKFRASYGRTGNDAVRIDGNDQRFPYLGSVNTSGGGYNFGMTGAGGSGTGGLGGVIEDVYSSPGLTWEIDDKMNFGLDLGLFKGQVDFSIDYFMNRRKGILVERRTIPTIAGLRKNPYQNFGIVENKGFDANLVYNQRIDNLRLSFRGNLTYTKNKVVEMDEVSHRYDYQDATGRSISQPIMYIAEGLYTPDDFDIAINPETKACIYTLKAGLPDPSTPVSPGDIKYKDVNGDGVIDDLDQTRINGFYPTSSPRLVYGFGLNADWKGFYVGVFFQGVGGVSANLLNKADNFMPFARGGIGYQSGRKEGLDRWRFEDPYNQDVLFPRMHANMFNYNMRSSTWWYRDASFIRLKNVEFGYDFNKKLLRKLMLEGVRVFVQGANIAVWDKVKYWDPELRDANSGAKYPLSGDWTAGVEVSF